MIDRLIVATNENDVLNEFFKTGKYISRKANETYVTSSPSMDISKASNFERFVYLLVGKDSQQLNELWQDVNTGKSFDLSDLSADVPHKYGFVSGKSTHADRINTIKAVYESDNDLIDPHTADGVKVARQVRLDNETIVVAETALPIKFSETIFEAVGEIDIPRPEHTIDIENLPQKVVVLDNDVDLVKALIQKTVEL